MTYTSQRMGQNTAQDTAHPYRIREISETETAKMVRQRLKAAFPTTRFSVTTKKYSGGSSITVHWQDGPTDADVTAQVGAFHGAEFDGMQDLKEYHDALLDGQRVRFANDYITTNRHYSHALYRQAAETVAARYGCEMPVICTDGMYAYIADGFDTFIPNAQAWFSRLINRELHTLRGEVVLAAPPKDTPNAQDLTRCTARYNQERNEVEVLLQRGPSDKVRHSLKANDFLWDDGRGLWHAPHNEWRMTFAKELEESYRFGRV